MKHATFIPLIGGFVLGAKEVLEKDPEFHITFPVFNFNQSFLNKYIPNITEYHLVDDVDNYDEVNAEVHKQLSKMEIDIVTCVPPCAGLSMLNASMENRGSDAIQNRFMKYMVKTVLGYLKPKVCVFENAPGLFSSTGEALADFLHKEGKNLGYSLLLYRTNTEFHGLPQKRPRTFGFFINESKAPLISWYRKERMNFSEYMESIFDKVSKEQIAQKYEEAEWLFEFKYLRKWNENWRQKILYDSEYNTFAHFLIGEKLLDDALNYAIEIANEWWIKFIDHIKNKISDSKGIWDSTLLFYRECTSSIISKNLNILHPKEDRVLCVDELKALMGLPVDFTEIPKEAVHVITQNVPVCTGADMVREAVKIIETNFRGTSSYIKMNNTNFSIYEKSRPSSLFEGFKKFKNEVENETEQ